eukprot:NODE_906_length_3192_cov_0.354995.p1 type:complete len:789 gc:universal NODE_906_length_3192_cov_0.354995:527-2893(+)
MFPLCYQDESIFSSLTMSAGIDVGNEISVISCARNRGIDVLTNTMSTRFIPTQLTYSNKRLLGELSINQKGVLVDTKKNILSNSPIKVNGQDYSPTQVLAMIMTHFKYLLHLNEVNPFDVVFSVPNYYTAFQNQCYYNASYISGFSNSTQLASMSKQVHLLKDTTAAALAYCMQHNPSNTNLLLVHLGDLNLEVTVALIHEGVHIKSHFAHTLNGSALNDILFEMARKTFQQKFKLDVKENARATQRLLAACEKCKKVLSANSQGSIHVEMLYNDHDLSMLVNRSDFEDEIKSKKFQIGESIDKAIQLAGLKASEIHFVECIGGNMRIPYLRQQVVDKFQEKVSSTLNPDECISKGCALYAAILSPQFKTRDMKVKEVSMFPIRIVVENSNPPQSTLLFPSNSLQPSVKVVTVPSNNEVLEVSAMYDVDAMSPSLKELFNSFNKSQLTQFNLNDKQFNGHVFYKASVQKITLTEGKGTVKLRCRLREDGMFLIERAYTEQIEVVEDKMDIVEDKMDVDDADVPINEKSEKSPEEPKVKTPEEPKTKTVKREIPALVLNQNVPDLNKLKEIELQLNSHDQLTRDTEDARNSLEEYVYTTRDKLNGQWKDYVDEHIKEQLSQELQQQESWLYTQEAEEGSKSLFNKKLEELKVLGEPIKHRVIESELRKPVIDKLSAFITKLDGELSSNQYEHITTEEMEPLAKLVGSKANWLQSVLPILNDPSKRNQDPPVWIKDIEQAYKELSEAARILNKPKPKPKEEVKKEEGLKDVDMKEALDDSKAESKENVEQ